MKYLVIALVSLLVAVALGHFIADDAGFVVIGYGGKVMRTSFVFFVAMLVAAFVVAYVLWRLVSQLFTVRSRFSRWTADYRRKRSQRALSHGLIALAEGDYRRAEQLLSRGADDDAAPALHYLGAAEAAEAQHAAERRDNYLSLAREAMPSAEVAIGIKRAEMQMANQQFEQARATLEYLADRHPDNANVLALQHRVYNEIGDLAAMMTLLPALRRHRVYDDVRLDFIEREAGMRALGGAFSAVEDLDECWNGLPRRAREHAACLALYARRLAALGAHEEAEKRLRKHLAREWDAALCECYGDVRIQNAALQLERAQAWLPARESDPDLLLCLGKLSINADDLDAAREYLVRLCEVAPSPLAYQILAQVYERSNDIEAANRCQREGLRLATSAGPGLPVAVG